MILYLMRHGQTDWNVEGRVQGWNDTPINKKGLEQAHFAGEKLINEEIETVYSSDLKRAKKLLKLSAPRWICLCITPNGCARWTLAKPPALKKLT